MKIDLTLMRLQANQPGLMRTAVSILLGALLGSLAACGPATQLRPQLGTAADLRRAAAVATLRHPDAPAVVLDELLHVSARLGVNLSDQSYATLVHKAVFVQREADRDVTEIALHLGEQDQLIGLLARTLAPDGREYAVDPQQIHGSTAKTTAQAIQSYRFRFPRVKPGSIVEYAYVIEHSRPLVQYYSLPTGRLPIDNFRLRVDVPVEAAAQFRLYGVEAQPKFVREGDNFTLGLDLADLAADPTEPMALTPALRDPLWVLRVDRYTLQGSTWWVFSDWADAAEPTLNRITESAAGVTLPANLTLPAVLAAEPEIAAHSAVQRLWRSIGWTGHGSLQNVRSAKEIFASQSASSVELTALLLRQLTQAGIRAEVALTSRALTNRFDAEFATSAWLNHALIYLPVQPGLAQPAWVDPSCPWCERGAVPPWLAGVKAVVARRVETRDGSEVKATLQSVVGSVDSKSTASYAYTATILPSGLLDLALELTNVGTYAEACLAGTEPTDQQLSDWAPQILANTAIFSGVLEPSTLRREASQGRCVRTHHSRVDGLIKVQSREAAVSLSFLGAGVDRAWQGAERHGRVGVEVPWHLRQQALVSDGTGGKPVGPNVTISQRHGGSSARCTVVPDGDRWLVTREIHIEAGEFTAAEYAGLRKLMLVLESCATRVVRFGRQQAVAGTWGRL